MTEVLSERSSRVVSYAKLHRAAERRDQGRFVAEGANAVASALAVGRAEAVLVADDEQFRHRDLAETAAAAGVPVSVITGRAASKLAETSTPAGIFAICPLLDVPLDAVLTAGPRLLAIAVEPREPGNAGTLIRCADAMGADAVILLGDAVDPHNGKCVRASAGSVFTVPVVRERAVDDALDAIRGSGISLLATAADGEVALDAAGDILSGRVAWLFGNEAHGLSVEVQRSAHHRVSIPIRGRAESLNVAAAAAICLYESARVHGAAGRV
ncbi:MULTISPECIES: TrmH family RNA methyltransferase [unclassified Gordonia (in: high G+C Gram-positive bacteria)]|uniref:TrmH family RNA methyltransferase n=1 Tax=unclassified Gordonia (in: high G+C Gram-positive bacteria) TaxID=2657482 RepID=UPI00071E32C3|nr:MULTISPECIES: RNA methyltransferase [unclassified Gordonia (in: high G+C Gram-positive bacteria)]KSU52086.1 RNA methyltransferase [Gordonia sp. SGD-V-85]SCC59006.1 RNA methyltransferase, TrmH family [Gordonia sp. v-85]